MRVAVIGAGVIGLATTNSLANRGVTVTCFEAVSPMSQRSSGSSRIFRIAHGTPELADLASAALRRYQDWAELLGARLVDDSGVIVTGSDIAVWAAAMAAAGVEHRMLDEGHPGLVHPLRSLPGPLLLDPSGGVLDARRVGDFLVEQAGSALVQDQVYALEQVGEAARVWSSAGRSDFDVVVIAAGAATCPLAAQVGMYTPSALHHHARFTFQLADRTLRPACLLERTETWKDGFTTYQHLVSPGRWAVGGHLDPAEIAWELGRDAVVAHSRSITSEYVRQNLDGVDDQPIDELYCTITSGWGDGYGVRRNGGFLTLFGDNLFKLAPVLAEALADAVVAGDTRSQFLRCGHSPGSAIAVQSPALDAVLLHRRRKRSPNRPASG